MKKERVKIYVAQRNVTSLEAVDWSKLIEEHHSARRIVRILDDFDLTELYAKVSSEKFCKGRPAIDPKVMLALLIYAAMKGLSSSREIAAHCKWEPGFRWILGHGLKVEYVTISTFRKEAGECLDDILTQIITVMAASGLVELDELILDGTKVKANAGRGSFHTEEELQALKKEIADKVEKLNLEDHKQLQKAKLRDSQERIQKALEQIPAIQKALDESAKKQKKGRAVKQAKVSPTDMDARQMSFADGSKAPGYNIQFMTASKSGVIVEVEVTQRRNDSHMLVPMIDAFEFRYKRGTKSILGDSGYCVKEDIIQVLERGIAVYCPEKKGRKGAKEESRKRLERKRLKEPEIMRAWRASMQTAEAKVIRGRRRQTEKIHGWIKSKMVHGQLRLRNQAGAKIEMLLLSIGYNLTRYFNMTAVQPS